MPRKSRKWRLGNMHALRDFERFAAEQIAGGKTLTVELVPEKRSVDQNALIYALYQEVAAQKEDESITDIRRMCKLHFGVPILRAANEEFRYVYDHAIKPLDYEFKLRAMDWLPVTSKMNKTQAGDFINAVIREFASQGIFIEDRRAA